MKRRLLLIIFAFALPFLTFARGTFPLETAELCVSFGFEDYLIDYLPSEYKVVSTHPSIKGSDSLKQENIRDIQITKNVNGEDKEVCYIYPYFETNKPKDIKEKLPIRVILNNKDKDFDESEQKELIIYFAIETNDSSLLSFLTKKTDYNKALEYIIDNRITKLTYTDYDRIKDKIRFDIEN